MQRRFRHVVVQNKHAPRALQRLQLFPWAPRILDSYQEAPGYAGEMFFFTVVDPAAPCLEERADDQSWSPTNRLLFARDAIRALRDLHQAGDTDEPMIHRVSSDGAPHNFSMTTPVPPRYNANRAQVIRKVSRRRFGQRTAENPCRTTAWTSG